MTTADPRTMSDYKHTLNLPETEFPMRGMLPKREPARVEQWQKLDIYQRLREARQGHRARARADLDGTGSPGTYIM